MKLHSLLSETNCTAQEQCARPVTRKVLPVGNAASSLLTRALFDINVGIGVTYIRPEIQQYGINPYNVYKAVDLTFTNPQAFIKGGVLQSVLSLFTTLTSTFQQSFSSHLVARCLSVLPVYGCYRMAS